MGKINERGETFKYVSDATAVATPLVVSIGTNVRNISIVVETDVTAGAGTIAVTGSVAGSSFVAPSTPISIDATAAPVLVNIGNESFDALTFTPTGITTATTYTVYIQGIDSY